MAEIYQEFRERWHNQIKEIVFVQCKCVLKHVKAWHKHNLHKIRKTVITLPGFGKIFAELAA